MELERGGAVHQVDGHPQQPQGGQIYGGRHATHLTVAAFLQLQLQPAGGNGGPLADRRDALRQAWIADRLGSSRQSALPLN